MPLFDRNPLITLGLDVCAATRRALPAGPAPDQAPGGLLNSGRSIGMEPLLEDMPSGIEPGADYGRDDDEGGWAPTSDDNFKARRPGFEFELPGAGAPGPGAPKIPRRQGGPHHCESRTRPARRWRPQYRVVAWYSCTASRERAPPSMHVPRMSLCGPHSPILF